MSLNIWSDLWDADSCFGKDWHLVAFELALCLVVRLTFLEMVYLLGRYIKNEH